MRTLAYTTALALAAVLSTGCASTGGAKGSDDMGNFASSTVSFGIVVSDIDRSLDFYTKALGLKEDHTFDVPAEMGRESGLSDGKPFTVHVLKLGDKDGATDIKLMEFPDAPGKTVDNSYIHSAYGIRYLTIRVKDMNAAVAQCRAAGVEPLANGPYLLPEGFPEGVYLTCVRDPDGNIIELVGPKQD